MSDTGQQRNLAEWTGSASYLTTQDLETRLYWGISFGIPIDIDSTGAQIGQHVSEIRGAWVTLSLVDAKNVVTVTHNLNIPPTSVTGAATTANLPNVRWFQVGLEYGDRAGNTAAPAVPAGVFSVSFMKMSDATVTANAIDLRYSVSGFAPDATHPVTVTLFVVAAAV